jgi:hypothetical protein
VAVCGSIGAEQLRRRVDLVELARIIHEPHQVDVCAG